MGRKHSAKTRRRIGEVKRQQFLEQAKERDPEKEPTTKRCPGCETLKPVEEFGTTKCKTKSGVISVRPRPYCRPCEAARVQRWKERKIAEGSWPEIQARRNANRDPAKRRRYHREYAAMRRDKEGVKPNKGRRPIKEARKSMEVAIEPAHVLVEVLEDNGYTREEIALRSGVEARRLYDMKHLANATTRLDNVDKLLIAFDREGDLDEMYPLEEDEKLVGYRILDPEGLLDQPSSSESKL